MLQALPFPPRIECPPGLCVCNRDALIGDPSKAEKQLGWKAQTDWRALAELMVDADRKSLEDQMSGKLVRIDR